MLDYDLGDRGGLSLYEYLYRCVRDDIVSGTIAADDRLPSKRDLARRLGVSLVTVEAAYAQLVAEGYVRSRPRSGFFANALPDTASRATTSLVTGAGEATLAEAGLDETVSAEAGLGAAFGAAAFGAAGNLDSASRGQSGDLSGSGAASDPDAARLWARALRATLATEPDSQVFSAAPAQGSERLRRAIADHLRRSRGLVVDPSLVVVGAGAQVLYVMLAQLLGHGRTYGVEDPGYLRLTRVYQATGAPVRHVPLDRQGVRMDELARLGVDVMHLMPSHQFPTGLVTSVSRRYELLGWASAGDRLIIEDDYDCEFRLSGRPVPPLAGIDASGCVVYANTFSKGLGPALRLAYMVLPPALMDRWMSELGFYSSTVSSVDQVALARILEDGSYARYVNRVRKRCRDLRDDLVGELRATPSASRMRVEEADSGLHLVLAVETDASEREIAARAAERGAAIMPVSDHAWLPENATAADGLRRFVVSYDGMDPSRVGEVAAAIDLAIA